MKYFLTLPTTILIIALSSCSGNGAKGDSTTSKAEQRDDTGSKTAQSLPVDENRPMLPDFTAQNVNGETVNLQSLLGKKVFVNLWASWCPPCKREMPSIEKLYQSTDTSKVAFVILSVDESMSNAKNFIRSSKLELPVYYPADHLPALFNVQSIPTTFIFNEKGELIKRIDGSEEYDTDAYRSLLK